MARLENLIEEIGNQELRRDIQVEIKDLKSNHKFGLVFEEHLPELVPIYSAPIRRGSRVAPINDPFTTTWRVLAITDGRVLAVSEKDGTSTEFAKDDVVVVKRFGEPVYPALLPVDRVERDARKPTHLLVEADNYHALQVLEYLVPGQVDCIYIDPPYNTGSRDWKYNNRFVDASDSYRHSKWLSFMKRRLQRARHLLKSDGTLVIAIDDHEHAHLECLLEDVFPEYEKTTVCIVHNPRGNITRNFAQIHEYAVYVTPPGVSTVARQLVTNESPRKLRRWGHNSTRTARPTMFYPIYVRDGKVTRIGSVPADDFHPAGRNVRMEDGEIEVWPIDQNGIERRWNFGLDAIPQHLDQIVSLPVPKYGGVDLFLTAQLSPPKTVWVAPELDAGGVYGSTLVETLVQTTFPFPKSLFTVVRCLDPILRERPNAVVLDFFAGSGTTLHAVALLNARYGGQRQCILTTNNEVSPEERAEELLAAGIDRRSPEFARHGICQSVTYPRCKHAITGRYDDGTPLPETYKLPTGRQIEREIPISVRPMDFTSSAALATPKGRRALLAALGLKQSKVAGPWYLEPDDKTAILFEVGAVEAFCDELQEHGDSLETILVALPEGKEYRKVRSLILAGAPPRYRIDEERRSIAAGFEENLQYMRLDFLDPLSVELGREFTAILPLLWIFAGSHGPIPEYSAGEPFLLADKACFAVLLEESYFAVFRDELARRPEITHVFLVTDSSEAFLAMKSALTAFVSSRVVQLYRNYLDNFRINAEARS